MSGGEVVIIAFNALYLAQPCFSAFTTTPNNLEEGLMGQVSTLETQFIRKETTIKEGEGRQKRGAETKISSDRADDQPSQINLVHLCLTVINTMLTVVHALKPSSSTHSLQIYCIGLAGPRSHTSWAWAEKHDPTIYILENSKYIILLFS